MGYGRVKSADGTRSHLWLQALHDLRQPTQSLVLLTEVMAETKDIASRRRTARLMEDLLLGMHAMLDDMGMVARIETDPLHRPLAAALPAIADRVIGWLAETAARRHLVIRPATLAPILIADPDLMESILKGMVANAVKLATTPKILLTGRRRSGSCLIDVCYIGSPLTDAHRESAFVEVSGQHEGIPYSIVAPGVALIVRMAALLGGELRASSPFGRIQRLTIELPEYLCGGGQR